MYFTNLRITPWEVRHWFNKSVTCKPSFLKAVAFFSERGVVGFIVVVGFCYCYSVLLIMIIIYYCLCYFIVVLFYCCFILFLFYFYFYFILFYFINYCILYLFMLVSRRWAWKNKTKQTINRTTINKIKQNNK